MEDSLIYRLISKDEKIRGFFLDSTSISNYVRILHNDTIPVTLYLSEINSFALILGQTLKNSDDRLTVQILCDGLLKHIISTSNYKFTVRGYCSNPSLTLDISNKDSISFSNLIGNGDLTIIKDMGIKQNYSSIIKIDNSITSLEKLFEKYFLQSSQIETRISYNCDIDDYGLVKNSSMFLFQYLPFIDAETKSDFESYFNSSLDLSKLYFNKVDPISIIQDRFNITSVNKCSYFCNCSYERGIEVLNSLPKSDLKSLLDQSEVEINCEFCNKKYKYPKGVIIDLINKKR